MDPGLGQTKHDPIRELHRKSFGQLPSQVAWAPGRVELLGGVSAAHEGLVLAATIDRQAGAAISPRLDGRVEWVRNGGRERGGCWLHDLKTADGDGEPVSWFKAQLRQLRRRRVHFSGFSATLESSIPPGLGLGEAAASSVALMLAIRRQFPFSLAELGADLPPRRDERGQVPPLTDAEKRLLIRWCQEAWRESRCGQGEPFDPWPALFGKAWHATGIDCRFGTVDQFGLIGEALVLCDTGVRADGEPGQALSERQGECYAASRALMAKALRSVDLGYLRANQSRLTERQHALAYHVIGEIQRVVYAERALRDEDHAQAGYYMRLSHLSAQKHFRTSWKEADQLVACAGSLRGCLGARMIGPGHGGAVICLVSYHEAVGFAEALVAAYREATGRTLRPRVLPMADGACR